MVFVNNHLNNINLNSNNFFVVMDFDDTITTFDSINSWSILENPDFVPLELKKESRKLFEKYYPIELDYTLDDAAKSTFLQEWYSKNIELFYKFNLTEDILLNCTRVANVKFRDGFLDFLDKLHANNIPVVIFSAGIKNVITEILRANNCLFDNVYLVSNFIEFKDNKMLPFKDKIIHSSNKDISLLPNDLLNTINSKDYILLFGNLVEDLNMVGKSNLHKTISFGFLEQNVEKNIDIYRNSYDVVLTDNSSFYDVEDVLVNLNRN